jgi:hypothetical protein
MNSKEQVSKSQSRAEKNKVYWAHDMELELELISFVRLQTQECRVYADGMLADFVAQ